MQQKRRNSKGLAFLALDTVLAIAFLAAMKPYATGMAAHEWLGLAIGVALVIHAGLHTQWLLAVTGKLLGKLPWKVRLSYAVDAALGIAFVTTIGAGVAMSRAVLPVMGATVDAAILLAPLHQLASYLTLGLVLTKLALHLRWIIATVKRLVAARQADHGPRQVGEGAAYGVNGAGRPLTRRGFLSLSASVLALAGLVALYKRGQADKEQPASAEVDSPAASESVSLVDDASSPEEAPSTDGAADAASDEEAASATAEAQASAEPTLVASAANTSTGRIRCPKGMVNDPYPGRCHHYRDENGNGYCDLSQAA